MRNDMNFESYSKITPESFYAKCVKKTHDLAEQHGFVNGGVKFIPELLPYCTQLINYNLNNPDLINQNASNEQMVIFLSYRCLMYGIILADTWHTNFSDLKEVVDDLEDEGIGDYIEPLITKLGFTPKVFNQWMEAVYMTCMYEFGTIDENGKEYSFKIMQACYQMGISMMLSHYGL